MLSSDNYTHGGSQGYNRYTYAMNNPLKYTDPDGQNPLIGAAIGAGISAGVYTANILIMGGKWNWNNFGRAVAIGAVGGALGGIFGQLGTQLGAFGQSLGYNVLSHVASNAATQLAFGNQITTGGVAGMVAGGLLGAVIGNFQGVNGGALENIIAELAFGITKGAITGGFGGGISAAIDGNNIAQGIKQGAQYGAIAGGTIASLNILTMGASYKPISQYGNFGKNGPIYRRGTFLTRALSGVGSGISIGRNLVTHQHDEAISEEDKITLEQGQINRMNHHLRAHETGHYQQQINMGFTAFYSKTLYQYFINPGFKNVYETLGTLEYGADQYANKFLGYDGYGRFIPKQ